MAELQLPQNISEIQSKRIRIDGVAKRLDKRRKEWQIWRSHDRSYEEATELYKWRNELDRQIPEKIAEYAKETPAVYELGYLKPTSDDGVKGLFIYGFSVYSDEKYLAKVEYKTEGIVAVLDKEVKDALVEVRGKDLPPLFHLPTDWSLLMEHSINWMEMRTSVYARWQPKLSDEPQLIKIPDTLKIEWEFHDPKKARTYTETEVLPND